MQFRYNPAQRERDARALAALDRQLPGLARCLWAFIGLAVLEAAASVVWLVLFALLFAGGNLRFAPAAARALKG